MVHSGEYHSGELVVLGNGILGNTILGNWFWGLVFWALTYNRLGLYFDETWSVLVISKRCNYHRPRVGNETQKGPSVWGHSMAIMPGAGLSCENLKWSTYNKVQNEWIIILCGKNHGTVIAQFSNWFLWTAAGRISGHQTVDWSVLRADGRVKLCYEQK